MIFISILDKLYKYIDDNNIILRYINDLENKHNVKGIFYASGENSCILIDKDIENDKRLHESILAEECGHYATCSGDTTKKIDTENYRVIVEKSEIKADKWKCNFIIPDEDLKQLLLKSDSLYEISEELSIDVEIVLNRLLYLSKRQLTYWINSNTYIDLTKLPNLVKNNIE